MKSTMLTIATFLLFAINSQAQYVQKEVDEGKNPVKMIFPSTKLNIEEAKNALLKGNTVVKGRAFTRPKNGYGFKAPLANRIFANHVVVDLFPYNTYIQDWYNLKKTKENIARNRIVYMDSLAYQVRLTCETNSKGEFTFPGMKPGKYLLMCTLPWSEERSYNKYVGSAYGSYGGQVNYYQRQEYTLSHSDFLIEIIEIKPGESEVDVKLK